MVTAILAGVALGALHAVTGPDHVAAVVPMSLESPWKGARTGLGWGLGHGAGIVILAIVALLFRELVFVDVVAAWSELAVGALLLGIGGWVLRLVFLPSPSAAPATDPHPGHAHPPDAHPDRARAAFGIGTLHGTAGMGHLVGVLPALGLPLIEAAMYLAAFLAGAAAAMTLVGLTFGALSARAGPVARQRLVTAAGIGALVVGVWWVYGAVTALA